MPVATSTPYSERTRPVLLGNLLLALAWAALQGEFSLRTLITVMPNPTSSVRPSAMI